MMNWDYTLGYLVKWLLKAGGSLDTIRYLNYLPTYPR